MWGGGSEFMWTARELGEWHDFYLLVGTAGATLVALLFVAVSIGVGILAREPAIVRTFVSPVVVHFAAVLFISAVMLAAPHPGPLLPAVIGATAVVGVLAAIVTVVRVAKRGGRKISAATYAGVPALAYGAILLATVTRDWPYALQLLAAGVLILLLASIRNAWHVLVSLVWMPNQ
jgi:hypothetical protein